MLRIVLLNVKGLRDPMKMRELITLARQRKYDLIIAAKSYILPSDIPQLGLVASSKN